MKTAEIDFLYLDLGTCERCAATDVHLDEALRILSDVFETLVYAVTVNKTEISTVELAEKHRLVSSPTIRVNGIDICGEVKENWCKDCRDLCCDDVDCRVFVYEGKEYEQPPTPMIVDGVLRVLYGNVTTEEKEYCLPENLDRFFKSKRQKNLMKDDGTFFKRNG